jgi:hypothetical protein
LWPACSTESGLPGFRNLPQDRLQDCRPLQGARPQGALNDRSSRPVRYANQSAGPDRDPVEQRPAHRVGLAVPRAQSSSPKMQWSGGAVSIGSRMATSTSRSGMVAGLWSALRATANSPRQAARYPPARRRTAEGVLDRAPVRSKEIETSAHSALPIGTC